MREQSDRFYIKAAWALIIGFSIFRIFYAGLFNLVPDETNYWQWSRHLAFGYHDQAPLIAWAIRLTTMLFGHTEIGVRLPSVLAAFIASVYLMTIAKRWFGAHAAWITAMVSQGTLIVNVGALLATPDGLQAAAWAAAGYHVACAYERDSWGQWILSGLWFGFGLLSKYTMIIFPPGVFLYGLLNPIHRHRLKSPRPYVGLLVGLLLFCPVIIWNEQNNWNSVRHVAYLGGANQAFAIHLKYIGEFIGSQAALLSPLAFILVLLAWHEAFRRIVQKDNWIYGYLFFTSFPMFAGFAVLSLHTRVYGNWPAAGYLTTAVLIAALFTRASRISAANRVLRAGRSLWPWAVGTSYLFSALLLIQVVWPVFPVPIHLDRTATEILGWKELGVAAHQIKNTMSNPEKTFLFGLRYQTASELAFYTPDQSQTVSINKWKRPNVYDYWWNDKDLMGWDAVGATYHPNSHKIMLNQIFERVDPPEPLKIFRRRVFSPDHAEKEYVKTLYLYRAYGFKGGLRWVPPNSSDIRAN
ncbi:MAG TPA: glycosyltransferase family 39 protein [Deltaproteobacteria bacterium]|nr:glycosyltransferase family 39 protein [Deltaproteobacteria bacterium]